MELLVVFAMQCSLGFSKSSYSLLSVQSYEIVGHFLGASVGGLRFWGTHLWKQSLGVLPALSPVAICMSPWLPRVNVPCLENSLLVETSLPCLSPYLYQHEQLHRR